ncbi:MAG: hypothetical protein NDJ18_03430 [candidate division Zixibacteria bacterium]|nr:hypothetical protein [candidate division Zixibacteria bacterium]
MSDDAFSLLMRTLGEQMFARENDPTGVVAMLLSETLRFRDKLKNDAGIVLTVEDTRIALDALEGHLGGQPLPTSLTSEQQNLTQIWIDRLTTFRSR